jgi:hypothetical protein
VSSSFSGQQGSVISEKAGTYKKAIAAITTKNPSTMLLAMELYLLIL